MKLKIIAIICSCFLVIGGACAGIVIYNQPERAAMGAASNLVEGLSEREELDVLKSVMDGGSVAFDVKKIYDPDNEVDMLDGAAASGKMYFSKEAFLLENYRITGDGLNLNGDVYFSKDEIFIKENSILRGAYGGKYNTLLTDYRKSIFNFYSDSLYAIKSEDLHNAIVDALENPRGEGFEEDTEKLLRKLMKDFKEIVCDCLVFDSELEKVRLDRKNENVRLITVIIEDDDLVNITLRICEYLREDTEIVEYLKKHGDVYSSLVDLKKGETVAEHYENFRADLEYDTYDICAEVGKAFEGEMIVKIATPLLGHKLLKLTVELDGENLLEVDFGKKGVKKSEKISLDVKEKSVFVYEILQNDRKLYKSKLEIGEDKELALSIDKSNEKYSVKYAEELEDGTTSFMMRGVLTDTDGAVKITVEKAILEREYESALSRDYIKNYDLEVTVTLLRKDKMPEVKQSYKGIDTIEEEDMHRLVTELGNVNEAYANEIKAAWENGKPYSYDKILEEVGGYVFNNGRALIVTVECDEAEELVERVMDGETVMVLMIHFTNGVAYSAEYRALTKADIG